MGSPSNVVSIKAARGPRRAPERDAYDTRDVRTALREAIETRHAIQARLADFEPGDFEHEALSACLVGLGDEVRRLQEQLERRGKIRVVGG